jgi:CheY-like chemotaxis protein
MPRFVSRGVMKHVLVVDDDLAIAQLLEDALQDEGCFVHAVGNPHSAFSWLAEHWPDVVLVDQHMPAMDGSTFIRACRRDPRGIDLRFVLMSADPEADHSLERGVVFLGKPFDLADLFRTVQYVGGSNSPVRTRGTQLAARP